MTDFESFSEDLIPRVLPQPTLHPVLDMSKPTVPEVSLIFDDSKQFTLNNETQPKSYKVWKQQQQQQQQQQPPLQQCQEPITKVLPNRMQTSDRKKIVTFDLPTESHAELSAPIQMAENAPIAQCQQLDLSLYDPRTSGNDTAHSHPANLIQQQQQQQRDFNGCMPYWNNNQAYITGPSPNKPILSQQLTNQMINSPNCAAAKEITLNEIYQLLQNMQMNNLSTGSTSTPPPRPSNMVMGQPTHATGGLDRYQHVNHFASAPDRCDVNANAPHSSHGEPSTRDIFNVILKQQEQLMNLQSQVQLLLTRNAHAAPTLQYQPHAENVPYTNHQIARTSSNANEMDTRKKQMSVMTSLEINVKNSKSNGNIQAAANLNTPENAKRVVTVKGNQGMKQCGCVCSCDEPKNVQSSDSGSNDDNLDASPDRGETQTGWTFYGNILNQVNDVLQSTPPAANATRTSDTTNNTPNVTATANMQNHYSNSPNNISSHSNMPKQIRTAQFKQVGFQIDDVNISAMSKRITFGSPSPDTPRTPAQQRMMPNDNSVLINALAMKYLPCDLNGTPPSPMNALQNASVQMNTPTNVRASTAAEMQTQMTPVAPASTTTNTTANGFVINRQNELDGSKASNTDMSITSYRYMEKYGLL